jgi:hypothetical protein
MEAPAGWQAVRAAARRAIDAIEAWFHRLLLAQRATPARSQSAA